MRILLIDDEIISRNSVAQFLEEQLGHQVTLCDSAQEGLTKFIAEPFPIVLSAVTMPGMSGLDLLRSIREYSAGRGTAFILMAGVPDAEVAVEALRLRATDLLRKPVDPEELDQALARATEELTARNGAAKAPSSAPSETIPADSRYAPEGFLDENYAEVPGIGRVGIFSDALKAVTAMAYRLHEDRTVPVLIEGETGTGKEIVARMVHYGRSDTETPFISINCSAISSGLFESELFGYEAGAFTGARKTGSPGKLELAQGGTLFLDEIGDMPLDLQPKLLRALQEKEIFRVGGLKQVPLNVRVIAATNRNLKQSVEQGIFRQDLYYRLNLGWIHLPPLRRQKEAIAPLAHMFLIQYAEARRRRFRFIHREALRRLENYPWPGNVRELQNTIDRVVLLYNDIELKPEAVDFLDHGLEAAYDPESVVIKPGCVALPDGSLDLETLETEIVRKAILKFNGNRSQAARYLGLTRSALRSRLR